MEILKNDKDKAIESLQIEKKNLIWEKRLLFIPFLFYSLAVIVNGLALLVTKFTGVSFVFIGATVSFDSVPKISSKR